MSTTYKVILELPEQQEVMAGQTADLALAELIADAIPVNTRILGVRIDKQYTLTRRTRDESSGASAQKC